MINANALLSEQCKVVLGLPPQVISSSTPSFVCMKGYSKCAIYISQKAGTSPLVGSAITLLQATNVGNASGKALAFSTARRCLDTANTDALSDFTVSSNTFTTNNTNTLNHLYEIVIDEAQLDVANNFDCLRVATGDGTNITGSVLYILYPAKFAKTTPLTAIAD